LFLPLLLWRRGPGRGGPFPAPFVGRLMLFIQTRLTPASAPSKSPRPCCATMAPVIKTGQHRLTHASRSVFLFLWRWAWRCIKRICERRLPLGTNVLFWTATRPKTKDFARQRDVLLAKTAWSQHVLLQLQFWHPQQAAWKVGLDSVRGCRRVIVIVELGSKPCERWSLWSGDNKPEL